MAIIIFFALASIPTAVMMVRWFMEARRAHDGAACVMASMFFAMNLSLCLLPAACFIATGGK